MEDIEAYMKKNKLIHIDLAIWGWTNKLNGIYYKKSEKRYTLDFCQEQIEYFSQMKTEVNS